ncbi:MAG: tRNA pseudouridine(55) synthase TruB [Candidatus Colwellbacteria bacterium GWA2_46_10]|uniref:tRNA pseudouridine synthase B n=1 Tax=Candidatus Colwellbacteria bacterium GWA2_46_10 TaxID=1797684 RepID=A0A1G1YVL8_9BACT|nr:MAG: tRNA pseudouridine synthase B [Microgenomates group bacterium GW2011_GWA1_Microgenomates_45_10]KKU19467.1 MAG: tRNA pseudouridine synthase B [Parcubacteria group bacterium GW2011_GWA2_46_10]OGY56412.1 MAG: tRNA pseudouridine(55) synthase TruB [Candidatus Colwellbacteria bacterium GWA2_46_10]
MIVAINKPKGITSHDVVNKIRKITNVKRVGHGGTLDPLASGVLVVAIGRDSTKKLGEILKNADKEYEATIEFGKTSPTDDAEGTITPVKTKSILNKAKLLLALKKFTGTIEQIPPAYSAVKISGRPAYKIARKGNRVALKKRKVTIKEAKLVSFDPPVAKIKFVVSSGTYIRSIARDLGKYLNVGGYLKELTRTRVGGFKIQDSLGLGNLAQQLQIKGAKEDGVVYVGK